MPWLEYAAAAGAAHPAVGNLDGDLPSEIVVGLDAFAGNDGWLAIFDDANAACQFRGWRSIGWPAFQANGGPSWPAIGKLR